MDTSSAPIRVLCVDDDCVFVESVASALERESISVVTAANVDDALDRLARTEIDCIICNYELSGATGLDFLQQVRQQRGDFPFILVTEDEPPAIASTAISTGATDCLRKDRGPSQYPLLANRIRLFVDRWRIESDFERRVGQQRSVAEFGTRALAETELQTLFVDAVERLADELGNEYANVLDWRPGQNQFELVAGVGWRDGVVGVATVDADPDSQAGYTLRAEEPVVVEEVRTEDRFRGCSLLVDHGVVSGINVVIGDIEAPWGVLGTHTTEHRAFSAEDVDFVLSVANVLANAVERTAHDRQFRAVFEQASDPMLIANEDGEYTDANAAACELFGLEKDELLGQSVEAFAPEGYDFEAAWQQFQENGRERDAFPLVIPDGTTRLVEYTAPTDIAPGQHRSILRDITDREEQQQALETSETRYRSLTDDVLDTSEVGTFILDSAFEVVWLNSAIEDYFGVDRDSAIGRDKRQLIDDHIKGIFEMPEQFAERVLATYDDNSYVEQFDCHVLPGETREDRWLKHWSQPIETGRYEGGRIEHYTDITEQKELEAALADTITRYQTLIEQNVAGIFIVRDGRFEYVNPKFCEILGYSEAELRSLDVTDVVAPDHREFVAEQIERRRSGADSEAVNTVDVVRSDGETRHLRAHSARIEFDGESAVLGTAVDSTDQHEYEQRLQQQNKRLEAFTSIVSHDLRNPLRLLTGQLELAEETGDPELFADCRSSVERMERLIEDLLALAQHGETAVELAAVSVAALVEDCWWTVETADASLTLDTEQVISADRDRLRQMLENLFRNAVEHGGENVTVTVGSLASGFYVEDDGPGIPADVRGKVFESGYSTSKDGTGFGLSIVDQFAEAHGWDVALTTGSDGGTRFEITAVEVLETE